MSRVAKHPRNAKEHFAGKFMEALIARVVFISYFKPQRPPSHRHAVFFLFRTEL